MSKPKRNVKLPASMDQLIQFDFNFTNLKTNIDYLARSTTDNEDNLQSLTIRFEEEIEKLDNRLNKYADMESKIEHFNKSMEDVYRMKDRVTS